MLESHVRRWIVVLLVFIGGNRCLAQNPIDSISELEGIEKRIQAAYGKVSPTVVRIAQVADDQSETPVGNGVIVAPEGIVATTAFGIDVEGKNSLAIYLAGGQRLTASRLGWSSEWRIALVKIDGDGPWPHVSIDAEPIMQAGHPCITVSYPSPFGQDFDRDPAVRFGSISKWAPPLWFATTCSLELNTGEFGSPAFDLDGQLLGIVTVRRPGDEPLRPFETHPDYTNIKLFRRHWRELVAGENLDQLRLKGVDKLRKDRADSSPSTTAKLNKQDSNAAEQAKRAAVRLRLASATESGLSGVIVSPDGYIVTCSHHGYLPLEKLTIVLSDGRQVEGQVLGVNPITDLGIAKITEPGKWPYVELGDSRSMSVGDPCLSIGYPGHVPDGQPKVRSGKIVNTRRKYDASFVFASTNIQGGDSGGGLFNSQAQVVGIANRGDVGEAAYVRAELLRLQWDFLAAGKPVNAYGPKAFAAKRNLGKVAKANSTSLVEVLCNGKQKILGAVVGEEGLVITKASELEGELSCRFSNEKIVPAIVKHIDHGSDLAILQVDLPELAFAPWSHSAPTPLGTLITIPNSGEPMVGVVSTRPRKIPSEAGWIPFPDLQETDRGLVVKDTALIKMLGIPIRRGDLILELDGKPIRTLSDYERFTESKEAAGALTAGDAMQVRVKRGNSTSTLHFHLGPPTWPRPQDESPRSSGFPFVFDTDIALLPNQCGAPVIDKTGCIVGIAIARRTRGRVYVVPSKAVMDSLNQ